MTGTISRRALLSGSAALVALGGARALKAGTKENDPMQPRRVETNLRPVDRVVASGPEHWVGDGFRVHGMLSPDGPAQAQSPFLLLDHASRRHFAPSQHQRGVGEHPHRGFETVTFAYRGEIAHRDSTGGGGVIGPGDVQWMTAASGVVHEELHSRRFAEQGGEMEMVQLWVNLPAQHKMGPPGYQGLLDAEFPRVILGAAEARLVAGSLEDVRGPARTHTPISLFDLTFARDGLAEFSLPRGFTALTFTLEGKLVLGPDQRAAGTGDLAYWSRGEGVLQVRGKQGARLLVLGGEPIDEPVAAYGPFVMNTREELLEAFEDYKSGKMGHL